MKISRIARIGAIGAVAALALAGCAANEGGTGSTDEPSSNTSAVSGSLVGAGASSQQVAIQAWTAEFQKTNPDAQAEYHPQGSGGGRESLSLIHISEPTRRRGSAYDACCSTQKETSLSHVRPA